jgi:hypothetical protein
MMNPSNFAELRRVGAVHLEPAELHSFVVELLRVHIPERRIGMIHMCLHCKIATAGFTTVAQSFSPAFAALKEGLRHGRLYNRL